MQRQIARYAIAEGQYKQLKQRMLNWAQQFSILAFLDSNSYADKYGRYECLLAAGGTENIKTACTLDAVNELHGRHKDWLFGHICYDYKNNLEPKLTSRHAAAIGFPELYFFIPEIVCHIDTDGRELTIESLQVSPDKIFDDISKATIAAVHVPPLSFQHRVDKGRYLETVDTLRRHIIDGDCYEINFCTEGYCEAADIDPLSAFSKLNEISPAPFAVYYRQNEHYLVCASPERYLQKSGDVVLSQPIKGTARRHAGADADRDARIALQNSVKDRAENVMIVDLVRNDLARCCKTGSVTVDELFGIYSFPQVHQMVSTVGGKMKEGLAFTDALRYSFPMGSMTGAPKVKVMELVDKYEASRRELFSGTVGYITPAGDFDFNVIIRSLFYNARLKYLSYQTGGAITYDSTPAQEWEEMRLKAWALEKVFA